MKILATKITFAHIFIMAMVVVGAAGFLLDKIDWEALLAGLGVAFGFASGHGLSPSPLAPRNDNHNQ